MMGHANVATTIDVYGGEFDKQRGHRAGEPAPGYGNLLETAPELAPTRTRRSWLYKRGQRLTATRYDGLRPLCKPEVTGSIPVRSISASPGSLSARSASEPALPVALRCR